MNSRLILLASLLLGSLACGEVDSSSDRTPGCTSDAFCPAGQFCNLALGVCQNRPTSNPTGGQPNGSGATDTAGDGQCTGGENAHSVPRDCPAVAGDGYCTHSESAATTPQDCVASTGDGYCTYPEDAATTPQDCPAVRGDGACTHSETAATAPQDCPAIAGDGRCTHSETAASTPQDCPAVAGDGFCTHAETFESAPSDCPPPDVHFPGGDLADLRAYSSSLVFGDLTLNGDLILNPTPATVTLVVESFATNGGRILVSRSDCDWSPAPDLSIVASGSVSVRDTIDLVGKSGVRTTANPSCNECNGGDGGNLAIDADTIDVRADLSTYGGRGSTTYVTSGSSYQLGCDGGNAGDVRLTASQSLHVGPHDVTLHGGRSGSTMNGNGDEGADGTFAVLSPSSVLAEREANATNDRKQLLPFDPITLEGSVSSSDDQALQNDPYAFRVTFTDGTPADFVEDLFYIVLPTATATTLTLDALSTNTDLDLYVMNSNLSTVAQSNGPSADESVSTTLAAGLYYVVVSWSSGSASDYHLTLQP